MREASLPWVHDQIRRKCRSGSRSPRPRSRCFSKRDFMSERRRRERGALAVEFGLSMPMLVIVIAGGLQFGRALITRHQLAEATNFATRKAVVATKGNPAVLNL